ncbi:hypothetical protein M8C13_38470 [Crossiella sp. SN42]|uniref:hypothetical protein n=1 Tax=Crossiella sp. SN42 TaxID=2944808 RepID=UPI00207CF541|nr:hypothetical protein [Crossiella sp. SN42]MCO1581650.1 hypothetical protein [Crossiella sp. SN42]
MRWKRPASQDPQRQLLDYLGRLDASWRDRVSAVIRPTLPGAVVTGYWLRTTTVTDEDAGEAGALDLIVATERVLAYLQFLALPGVQRWRLVDRTQTWALCELASVATETLPAAPGGQDGLCLQIAPPGATSEVKLTRVRRQPEGEALALATLLGTVRPEVLRIVVEATTAEATEEENQRQRLELDRLRGLAEAVHRGLAFG